MQVEAIYNRGKLEFLQPMRFRHDSFVVTVEVPEQEILGNDPDINQVLSRLNNQIPQEVIEEAKIARQLLDEVMNAQLPETDDLPPLSAKKLERIKAFSQREDR